MAAPLLGGGAHPPLDDIAHIVQLALTPVFLLSGVGTLLNVFNTRLARVSDHSEHVADLLDAGPSAADAARLNAHLARLRRRIVALDTAIALGAWAGRRPVPRRSRCSSGRCATVRWRPGWWSCSGWRWSA